jgi:nucleoside-diphosphate-sugar epimerase
VKSNRVGEPLLRLILTGASGYIGERLVQLAVDRGYEVVVLGSAPSRARVARVFPWHLGEEPLPVVFAGATAVVHLGHSWISDSKSGVSPANVNLVGTKKLASAALAAGISRFIFASSTSARPGALNAYGRIKHAIEQHLLGLPHAEGRVLCARIGLVYGGAEKGQYGLLSKLVRMTPVLPMIGIDRKVQPIHVDEVCGALLALASDAPPQREGPSPHIFVVAAPEPVTFGDWLRKLRFAHTGRRMLLLPVSIWVALFACDMFRVIPLAPKIDRERILGLAGATPMDSAADLAALEVSVLPADEGLASIRPVRRRRVAEAIALLSYVAGKRIASPASIARLLRGIDRLGAPPLGLPRLVVAYPALLRAFEPIHSRVDHRLAERLHLAAMVVESMHGRLAKKPPKIAAVMIEVALDALAIPFRLVLGRRFA